MQTLIIKRGWQGKFTSLLAELGVEKGSQVVEKVVNVVSESFLPHKAPMRTATEAEMNRRLDLAVEIVFEKRREPWHFRKIIDMLESLLDERLQIADPQKYPDKRWVTKEKNAIPLELADEEYEV